MTSKRRCCTKTRPMPNSAIYLCILSLAAVFGGCATKPPVIVMCEQPDRELVKTLDFCPAAGSLGELEDCLVEFVHKTLPADNAKKAELLRQLETLKQRRE